MWQLDDDCGIMGSVFVCVLVQPCGLSFRSRCPLASSATNACSPCICSSYTTAHELASCCSGFQFIFVSIFDICILPFAAVASLAVRSMAAAAFAPRHAGLAMGHLRGCIPGLDC